MKVKLGDICNIISGNAWSSSKFSKQGIPIIRINNLNKKGRGFAYWDLDYDPKYLISKNDILLSLSGTIKVYRWHGEEALLNQRILKIVPNTDINSNWIYYKLLDSINLIINKARYAIIKNVSINAVKNIEFDLPDLETQDRIVAVLDKANDLIEKREEAVLKLEELLDATFLNMFGLKNPSFQSWNDIEIGNLKKSAKGSMRTGPFGSNLKHDRFKKKGEVAVLGIDNAVDNEFKWKKKRFLSIDEYEEFKRYTVYSRDVIITIMGTVGKSAVIPNNIGLAINTKHLAALTLDESLCNPYYLSYSIHSNPYVKFQLKKKSRGAIMDGLNLTSIKAIKLKKAPIELQNKFEKIYLEIHKQKNRMLHSRDKSEILLEALSQLAFKGELKFNTAVDLEVLMENDFEFFKNNSNKESIILLLERLNKDELNSNKFYEQELYDKAKNFVFELLNEKKIMQIYDKDSKRIKLHAK
nr:restriction endonuclease subunit S [uncultured Psychroserpens sp.]